MKMDVFQSHGLRWKSQVDGMDLKTCYYKKGYRGDPEENQEVIAMLIEDEGTLEIVDIERLLKRLGAYQNATEISQSEANTYQLMMYSGFDFKQSDFIIEVDRTKIETFILSEELREEKEQMVPGYQIAYVFNKEQVTDSFEKILNRRKEFVQYEMQRLSRYFMSSIVNYLKEEVKE